MRKLLTFGSLGVATAALVVGVAAQSIGAADHLDAPGLSSPGGDGRLDITDLYAFQHGSNTVLALNVDPGAGVLSPTTFRNGSRYEILIDNNGDAVPDMVLRAQFSGVSANGRQSVALKRVVAGQETDIAGGLTGSVLPVVGGGSLFAGPRDDPFFFDLAAFLSFKHDGNPADFCGGTGIPPTDFFKGLNVASIVVEVPTTPLLGSTSPIIHVWSRTTSHDSLQVDRMGKPAMNTVFIPSASKNAYNAGRPDTDLANFGQFFPTNPIPLLGGVTVQQLLLGIPSVPAFNTGDELILNTSGPLDVNGVSFAGYPNGRQLQDDVIDTSFAVLSNAGVLPATLVSDCVANDSTFSATFPYMAPPN